MAITGKGSVKRYHEKAILHVGINFNRNTEPELVEKMESVGNRSKYIKDLMRADIEKEKKHQEGEK